MPASLAVYTLQATGRREGQEGSWNIWAQSSSRLSFPFSVFPAGATNHLTVQSSVPDSPTCSRTAVIPSPDWGLEGVNQLPWDVTRQTDIWSPVAEVFIPSPRPFRGQYLPGFWQWLRQWCAGGRATAHSTLYNVHCTLYTVHCKLCSYHNLHCVLYTVHCILYNIQCTRFNVQCTMSPYNIHCTLFTAWCSLYTAHHCANELHTAHYKHYTQQKQKTAHCTLTRYTEN